MTRTSPRREARLEAERNARADLALPTAQFLARLTADLAWADDANGPIIERALAFARSQGLSPIGPLGARVAYAPQRHRVMGDPVHAGTWVTIERLGFAWAFGDEEPEVALPALVTVA